MAPMGNCCSSTSDTTSSPATGPVPQQQDERAIESGLNAPISLPPLRQDAMLNPTNPVKHDPIPASSSSQSDGITSQFPSPKSVRSRSKSMSSPHHSSKSHDNAWMEPPPVPGGEMSQKPLPAPGRSRFISSPHDMSRSVPRNGPSLPSGAASSESGHVHGYRRQNRVDSAPDPRSAQRAAKRGSIARSFPSTVRDVLPDGFRFRILVLGKSLSGKSSLVNAVFNVDMAAASGSQPGNVDINVDIKPRNNRYLIVHEYSGLESGDAQSMQTIRDFVSYRTDTRCPVLERLHAIWICVPMSDAIERGLGEGVTKMLGMKKVPVLIVFTKFDLLVSRVQFDITRGVIQTHDDPRARAYADYEALCRSLFHKDPKDAPAAIFSEKQAYRYLFGELTSTTHRFIADSHNFIGHPTSSHVQIPTIPGIFPELLAWSVAQRVDHDITIQASIEVGRSRYWRSLGSSQDFTDQALESCVNVIHEDIINVWNFDDREGYLLNADFTARMSHLVGDLAASQAVPAISPELYLDGTATPMAQWTNGPYQNTRKNIRCMMAYIVDLTVILYGLFESRHNVSARNVRSSVRDYAKSISRGRIHEGIRSFVSQIPDTYQNRDTFMMVIADLIKQNCVQTPDRS